MTTTIEDDGLPSEYLRKRLLSLGDDTFAGIVRTSEMPVPVLRSIITELLSLRSSPAVDGVGVKPLHWTEVSGSIYDAHGIGILYRVKRDGPNHWAAKLGSGYTLARCSGLDEAKSAAQADYETRVRSAISPTSDSASVVEACAAAALGEPENALRAADPDHPESDYACGRVDAAAAVRAALSPRSS